MGKLKLVVRDLESVNFDKICRLALSTHGFVPTKDWATDMIFGHDPVMNLDIEGDEVDREYWKRGGRSMTELYAIRVGLAKADASGVVAVASNIPGLVSLCEALAQNHGKVPGVKGGSLYKKGMIPSYARELSLLPKRAPEILGKLVKAVAQSLYDPHPITAMIAAAGGEWDEIDDALASANRAVYEEARVIARALRDGTYAGGNAFPLENSPKGDVQGPVGIIVTTRNPTMMKHLWAALKSMEPAFKVATAVVVHPDTGRIAILSSTAYRVDVRPVAEALALTFGDDFDVNHERGSIVWDPRFASKPGVMVQDVIPILAKRLAFRKEEPVDRGPRFGATLGDRFGQKRR